MLASWSLLSEYLALCVFVSVSVVISSGLLFSSFFLAPRCPDVEKTSPYECGFAPFDDARMPFNARFYLVAILFVIFDLELAFLFPWAAAFGDVGVFGFLSVLGFLTVLTVGYVYEWRQGALEWD